ncbi:MAG: hypothetical protein IPG90_10710 [Bacteroidetes bacterium]|nr:hypothetical protein [Bacteroidota bacterium]
MPPIVLYGDRVSVKITREFKQLVNISIAAGKFILLHPDYDLIREAMRLEMFEDERLEDFEVHNWQFEVDEVITYDQGEILFFYALLELSCRIFLCEIGDDLKKWPSIAAKQMPKNLSVSEVSFSDKPRISCKTSGVATKVMKSFRNCWRRLIS